MDNSNVGDDFINEICRDIDRTRGVDCFDLCSILKQSPITNMQFVFCYIYILYPERKSLDIS